MMTQDRATHPIATPTSPRNLNPSAPAFRQGQAAPASPKNLNPAAPAFHQSPGGGGGDKSVTDGSYPGADSTGQGLLTNGDIYANPYMVPLGGNGVVMHQGGGSHPQGVHHQVQSPQNGASMGLSGSAPHPLLAASTHQAAVPTMSPHQQSMYAMAVQDSMAGQHAAQKQVRILSQSSPPAGGMNETGDSSPIGGALPVSVEEVPSENAAEDDVGLEGATGGQGYKYPDQILAPITNQMQFYFSNENLPNDKFLNQHMDADKFIPLELFLDFGRIKPICNNIDQLIQAVESSSILELSEDRKKVRVSQCRKTLTLRGFPASATEEDVRQFILEMGACVPTHIEFVMFKEKYSVWYVSFKDEAAALNSFFQFHNKKAVYKDHNIGCCIKSSGTLAAAGYFPSSEESNQRRMAHQNPAAVAAATAAVHVVQSSIPQPQPQQPQALMQPFSPMQLHSYMPSSPAGIYYQQTPQGAYMPYMAGMIQGWPNPAAALEPGLIMQNNGLQPQHIHTSMPRPHLLSSGSGAQHRYSRPPRARQNILERSASERPSDRTPVVSVSGPSRSAPRSAEGASSATLVPQGAYMPPRRSATRDDMTMQVMTQPQALSHTFVTPMVTQHQHITPPAAVTAPPPSTTVNPLVIESMAVPHYQAAPQPHPHQQAGPVLIQQQPMPSSATTSHPPPPPPQQQTTSNPLPLPPPPQQLQMHHHHHSQPPPAIQHQQQQQQQPPHPAAAPAHHQQQGPPPHNNQHHMPLPPPPPPHPPHHQHTPQMTTHTHHPHQHAVVPHHHHAQQQQQHHHTAPPPPPHHQQPLQNNRPERKGRRRREDNVRNPRSERHQSNRVNFSCQAPAAADNFTMEANSFPPLPGALSNIANSEISHENRMSDIVRGISRNSVGNSGVPRALSTTPSPVATPAPAPLTSGGAPLGQHHGITASALLDVHGLDDRDSPLDDDTTSSSQEEVDTDINSVESRSVRSEPQSVSSGTEQPVFPSQPRSQKATTLVAMSTSAQKQADNRQGSYSMQVQGLGSQQEIPKPSYAQILALKNREAANNASAADSVSIGGLLPSNSNSGTPNGPGSGHVNNSIATSGSGRAAATTQPSNAFREHGNYQGGPPQQQLNSRPSQRGPSKDLSSRPDGSVQSTRPPNGNRRNSKENRTSIKFDRRKPETRQKQF